MSTKDLPLVSVVTPTYNNGEFIAQAIESVLKQSYSNFEYIIVNNCSKDDTLQVARKYAAQDSRIRVHDNTDFLGVIENHNLAFSLTSPQSKYVKVVSGDDWIFPESLAALVALAEAHPNVGLVGSYSLLDREVLYAGLECERSVVNGRELCRATLLGGPHVFGSPTSMMYRADLVRKTKAFYPTNNPHADTSACYLWLQESDFGFVHQVLSYTRVHSQSQTSISLKFGTHKRANIANVLNYGATFLSEEEYQHLLSYSLDKYYTWLLPALFENSFSKEFIERQRKGLADIGLELDLRKVGRALFLRGWELLQSPGAAVGKTAAMLKRRGIVPARYY